MLHIEARRNQALKQRLFYRLANAEHLARGLHLGAELGVHVVELFKREHGHLYGDVRRVGIEPRAVAELFELGAYKYLGGELNHRHARNL